MAYKPKDDYGKGYRAGIIAAAKFAHERFAPYVIDPYRVDDVVMCKFNCTARAKPRRVGRIRTAK